MNHTVPSDQQVFHTVFWIIMAAAAVFISAAILLVSR
jgi:hypothetical protein